MDEQRTNARCRRLGFFFTFLHLISVSFCGLALLHLKKRKEKKMIKEKIPVVCSTFCRTIDVNVCTLYSTFIKPCRVLSLGENIEVYKIISLFFYVKKITITTEKIFQMNGKR